MKKPLLFAAVIIGLALPGFVWTKSLTPGLPWSVYVYEGGRLAALLAFVLMFFQFVLSSRIPWVERRLGSAALFKMHRRWGVIAFVLILSHPALLLVSERLQGYASALSLIRGVGVLALGVLGAAVLAALLSRRLHLKLRTWKRLHRAAYGVFPLGWAHSFIIGTTIQEGLARGLWVVLAAGYVALLAHKVLRRSPRKPAA